MFTDVYGISGIIHHFALLPDHRWLKPCGCRPVGRPNSILVPCEKFSFLGNAFCIRNVYCESCSSPTDNRVNNRPLNAGATGIEMANSFRPPKKKRKPLFQTCPSILCFPSEHRPLYRQLFEKVDILFPRCIRRINCRAPTGHELVGELLQTRRCKLVVLAIEVGGRWSQEATTFLRLLA